MSSVGELVFLAPRAAGAVDDRQGDALDVLERLEVRRAVLRLGQPHVPAHADVRNPHVAACFVHLDRRRGRDVVRETRLVERDAAMPPHPEPVADRVLVRGRRHVRVREGRAPARPQTWEGRNLLRPRGERNAGRHERPRSCLDETSSVEAGHLFFLLTGHAASIPYSVCRRHRHTFPAMVTRISRIPKCR